MHSDRRGALLDIAGLIDGQDPQARAGMELFGHPGAGLGSDLFVIPCRAGEQVLEPVGVRLTGYLGQGPAIASFQVRHHRHHQGLRPQSRLDPPEGRSDAAQQRFQTRLPPFDR